MMSQLKKISEICNNSVTITVNLHRDYHQSAIGYLFEVSGLPSVLWQNEHRKDLTQELIDELEITHETLDKMIELDTIVEGQFYPRSSNGFFTVFHYDVDALLSIAAENIKDNC